MYINNTDTSGILQGYTEQATQVDRQRVQRDVTMNSNAGKRSEVFNQNPGRQKKDQNSLDNAPALLNVLVLKQQL